MISVYSIQLYDSSLQLIRVGEVGVLVIRLALTTQMVFLFLPAALVGVAGPFVHSTLLPGALMRISEGRQPKYSSVTCSCHQSLISQTHGETQG